MPTDLGISFVTPVFYVETADKSLNSYAIDLKITCESPLSVQGPGGMPDTAVNEFRLTYRNQCLDSVINPASRGSYQIPLYAPDTREYTPATQTIPVCPKIYEKLIMLSTDALEPADF